MKRLFFFLIILVIAILIGLQIKTNPGYVLISTTHVAIETRLWFALLFLVVLFLVLYFIVRFFKYTHAIPSRWQRWRVKEKTIKATRLTYQGLLAAAKGDWSVAQKKLMRDVKAAPAPLVNYLAAAIAAARDGDQQQRDQYLRQAYELVPNAKLAVGLVQAQLQYGASQYELALATLKQLVEMAPKQKQVLRLLAKVYKKLGEWISLVALLPELQKQQLFPEKFLSKTASLAYCHIFTTLYDAEQLMQVWKKAPHAIRGQADIVILYVRALIQLNQMEVAEELIRKNLKHSWSSELVLLYAEVDFDHVKKQLSYAEQWLKAHVKDPQLLFVLGQLAERNQLWGKAKDYYQASLDICSEVKVYAALAKLLEQLGELDESLVYYRRGLLEVVQ